MRGITTTDYTVYCCYQLDIAEHYYLVNKIYRISNNGCLRLSVYHDFKQTHSIPFHSRISSCQSQVRPVVLLQPVSQAEYRVFVPWCLALHTLVGFSAVRKPHETELPQWVRCWHPGLNPGPEGSQPTGAPYALTNWLKG